MQNMPAVGPLLVYAGIERAHEYLVRTFGFTPRLVERMDVEGRRGVVTPRDDARS